MDRFFQVREQGGSFRGEVIGGVTTFLTMAYIIVVQPAVLSGVMFGLSTGIDFGAVMTATCLSAALATALMGLYARYPIALAPGMGENFVFVFSLLPAAAALPAVASGRTTAWAVGLGVMLIAGVLFFLLSLTGFRHRLMDALSPSLKSAMAAGIGLFIAFIGLQNAGVIVKDPGTAVRLNPHLASPDLVVFFVGLFLMAVLQARRVRGAILWGMAGAGALAWLLQAVLSAMPALAATDLVRDSALMRQFAPPAGVMALPPSLGPTFLKADLGAACTWHLVPFIVIFLFMDLFDTLGTLVGVCEQGGFSRNGRVPRAERVLLVDAAGTVVGAALGTSTVTSFIESAAGVEQGARTGLANLVTAALFLLALFFEPVVRVVGAYAPITAPALVVVGALMLRNAVNVDWTDVTEAVPAFLVLVGIPFSYSIADGLALGFISYPAIKVFSGRGRETGWLTVGLGLLLLAYFIAIRSRV